MADHPHISTPAEPRRGDHPRRVLVTAGPTWEPIDAVRFIGNRSSGRMGIAIAAAFAARGHDVTLLLGPTNIQPVDSSHHRTVRFRTTADLERLLHEHWPRHDLLVMAAAVADFRPASPPDAGSKIARTTSAGFSLDLVPTPDLLASLKPITRSHQRLIGFALETRDQLLTRARSKLIDKGLHAIVANPLETMDSESVEAVLILADGRETSPPGDEGAGVTKSAFARWLAEQAAQLFATSSGA